MKNLKYTWLTVYLERLTYIIDHCDHYFKISFPSVIK